MSAKVLARTVVAAAALAMVTLVAPPARSVALGATSNPLAGGTTTTLASGVTLTELTTGSETSFFWTVHVYVPAEPDGPINTANTGLGPRPTAERVAEALTAKGFTPRVERVDLPAFADGPAQPLGWTVRVGAYASQADATTTYNAIRAAGFRGQVRWTGGDGDPGALQHMYVVRVDFTKFNGTVASETGPSPALNELDHLSDIVPAYHALAGINTQWFYNKAPGGLYVKDGKVLSAATQGRGGVAITRGGKGIDVATYRSTTTLYTAGSAVPVDGINRVPGQVWNCGGIGGDQPTEHPMHDIMCIDPSELLEFTPEWKDTPSGPGTEVVLDAKHRVTAVNETRGTTVPATGSTIQGTGDDANWLAAHVHTGDTVRVETAVTDGSGRRVPLTRTTTIIQTGPTLVRDGRVSVDAYADGIIHSASDVGDEGTDQTFTYNWTVRGNPRSAIGVDAQGRLLLVAVDGRQPGYSEGVSIEEEAQIMHRLGAVQALNFDGGGSTVMVTGAAGIVNHPSDATGERELGNPILVEPRR
ncbi:phosphodiester glycosidase family protein [Actinopolymorpha sp. NPDC004070]|uniref:phosphodiester glycosidase family protein n=1 Tax=Actinopolymorpha sp. NPDC004070 TaxID=3154548 RepID=UPI0033BB85BB